MCVVGCVCKDGWSCRLPAASSSASVLKKRTVDSRWHSPPSVKALATNVPSAHTWCHDEYNDGHKVKGGKEREGKSERGLK